MTIRHRLQKLEKKMSGKLSPWIVVSLREGEDKETAINAKLKAEGVKRDQSNILILPFYSAKNSDRR